MCKVPSSLTNCLMQFYLSVLGSAASSRLLSAPSTIYRPVSSGTQQYSSDPSRYPLTKPMTKLAAKLQVRNRNLAVCYQIQEQKDRQQVNNVINRQTDVDVCFCLRHLERLSMSMTFHFTQTKSMVHSSYQRRFFDSSNQKLQLSYLLLLLVKGQR